jgi:hypothetical protein
MLSPANRLCRPTDLASIALAVDLAIYELARHLEACKPRIAPRGEFPKMTMVSMPR